MPICAWGPVSGDAEPILTVSVSGGFGASVLAAGGGAFVDVLPEEEGPAFRGEGEAGGQADEGGLAAPVGPRQGVDLPRADGEAHALQDGPPPVALAHAL